MSSTRRGDGQSVMEIASRVTPRKSVLCEGTRQFFEKFTLRPSWATCERRITMSRVTSDRDGAQISQLSRYGRIFMPQDCRGVRAAATHLVNTHGEREGQTGAP